MKRSDFVTKLQQFVYDATDCQTSISLEEASLVLEFIEKEGMLPPKIVNPKHAHRSVFQHADYRAIQNAYCKHPDDSPYELNEWEDDPEMFPDGAK